QYVTARGWEQATLEACPLCEPGQWDLQRLARYMRKVAAVAFVAGYYCPEQQTTFGLLPDVYARRMAGPLDGLGQGGERGGVRAGPPAPPSRPASFHRARPTAARSVALGQTPCDEGTPQKNLMRDDTRAHDKRSEEIALFPYGLISDLIHPTDSDAPRKLYERLRDKASRSYCIPATRRTHVAVETLRDWVKLYQRGGFDALKPKPRKDIGSARAIPQPVIDDLVEMKDQHRSFSVAMVIDA